MQFRSFRLMRRTIAHEIGCDGTALHAGSRVGVRLLPAVSGNGVVFRRDDLGGAYVPARYDRVSSTRLGTVVSQGAASVAVVEHLMAAIMGAELDDLVVALDGPELPVLAGDALSWLEIFESAGVKPNAGTRDTIRVRRRIEVSEADASAALEPGDLPVFDFEIAFATPAVGTQRLAWTFSPGAFRRDIAPARTFGFVDELDALRSAGLARGASLENTLAIEGDRVLNAELQRFADEFVRHKILDAVGDLALAGASIIGCFKGRRSGHALNNALLRAMFSDPSNYEIVAIG